MPHSYRSRPTKGHAVNTEMTGSVPDVYGPHVGGVHAQAGCLPIHMFDASSEGVRAPKETQTMRWNRVPEVRLGIGKRRGRP